ncbi:MAG TPA: hypothetical protein VMM78_07125 [Thermomicrobiales bacterium]|nr:hypothetical protein [Thermomicrobiales bacterium]
MHSFLAQAEYGGEIMFGVMLGTVAWLATITIGFTCLTAQFAGVGLMVPRAHAGRR